MKENYNQIRVGCGALIINEKKEILLLKRGKKARNSAGFWSKPGGTVELGEKITEAIKREIKEELNIELELLDFLGYEEHFLNKENQHWISLSYSAKIIGGELKNLEPEKHDEIKWFRINALPENLVFTKTAVEQYLKLRQQ